MLIYFDSRASDQVSTSYITASKEAIELISRKSNRMSESNKRGMLRGIFITSPEQIKRVMRGLSFNLLNPITDPVQPQLRHMQFAERTIATRILRTIRAYPDNPLLLEATLTFIAAVEEDNQKVIKAAIEFESLAYEEVFVEPVLHIQQYSEAREQFNKEHYTNSVAPTKAHLKSIVCF